MKWFIPVAVVAHLLSSNGFALKTVDYFAGKDESCLVMGPEGVVEGAIKKMEPVEGRITQLISITDYMQGSSESYCTVVVTTSGKKTKAAERRFSSSPSNCEAASKLALSDKPVRLQIVKDHVCEVKETGTR